MGNRIKFLSGHPAATGTPLRRLADRYLESNLAGDLTRAPLAADFRASVNAKTIATETPPHIEDFPALQIFPDPQASEVILTGVAMNEGVLRPYVLRLKARDERIIESETILGGTPKGHFADVDQLLKPDPLYDAPVLPCRASDRGQLRAAADSYWEGLQQSDGSIPKFAYRCERFDNGKKITNNLSMLLSPEATVLTCTSGLYGTRPARPVARARRFPVLDVELGVAASFVMVDFKPNSLINLPGMTHYMLGLFKVVDGEIRSLDEITVKLDFGTPSIW
jgi:hypothetical protein